MGKWVTLPKTASLWLEEKTDFPANTAGLLKGHECYEQAGRCDDQSIAPLLRRNSLRLSSSSTLPAVSRMQFEKRALLLQTSENVSPSKLICPDTP